MPYYLRRDTPIDHWKVYSCDGPLMIEGEVIALPDCHWYSEAQAEADRRNGKGNSEQGVLELPC